MSGVSDSLLPLGALLIAKSVVVLAVAKVLSGTVVRTPARRVWVWRSAYVALAILPLLQFALPGAEMQWFEVSHAGFERELWPAAHSVSVGTLGVSLWFAGVFLSMLRFGSDWHAARGLVRRSAPCDCDRIERHVASFETSAKLAGISLRMTSELNAPSVFGWRRPTLLLPQSVDTWSDDEVRAMLLHELEHVRRADWLMMVVERIVGALYWPNFLLRSAHRAAAAAREVLADRAVLRGSVNPGSYASQLLRLSRLPSQASACTLTVAFAAQGLEHRVRELFVRDEGEYLSSRRAISLLVTVSLAGLVGLATVRPWACLPGNSTQAVACN